MNNKITIEFGFRIIRRIMWISGGGVIAEADVTASFSIILLMILSLIQ